MVNVMRHIENDRVKLLLEESRSIDERKDLFGMSKGR